MFFLCYFRSHLATLEKLKGVKIMREMDAILKYKLTDSKILWRGRGLDGVYLLQYCRVGTE